MGFLKTLGRIGRRAVDPLGLVTPGGVFRKHRSLDPSMADVDPDGLARARYDQLTNPQYQGSVFEAMAGRSAGTLNDYLAQTAASGGSSMVAGQRFQDAQTAARSDSLDAFTRYRLGADQQANQVLGLHFANNQFRQGALIGDHQQQNANNMALQNSILSGLFSVGGTVLGKRL